MITISEDHRGTAMSGHPVSLPGGLHCIDLPQPLPGFRRFISAWLFTDPLGRRVLVDPGPANTVPLLIRELESLTDGIDLILLTHIHLDHSGGLGQLCARFPGARTNPEWALKTIIRNFDNNCDFYKGPISSGALDDDKLFLIKSTIVLCSYSSFLLPISTFAALSTEALIVPFIGKV